MNSISEVDKYIAQFSDETQNFLEQIRKTIKEIVPEAQEAIKYGMPTFVLNGNLVHFAAFKNHIGFYPAPSGIDNFKEELIEYKTSKGAIQFPFNKPIPWELIKEIVKFRLKENLLKIEAKKKQR